MVKRPEKLCGKPGLEEALAQAILGKLAPAERGKRNGRRNQNGKERPEPRLAGLVRVARSAAAFAVEAGLRRIFRRDRTRVSVGCNETSRCTLSIKNAGGA